MRGPWCPKAGVPGLWTLALEGWEYCRQGQHRDVRRKHRGSGQGDRSVNDPGKADSEAPELGTCLPRGSRSQKTGQGGVAEAGGWLTEQLLTHAFLAGCQPTRLDGTRRLDGEGRLVLHGLAYPKSRDVGLFWGGCCVLPLPCHTIPSLHLPPPS